MSVVYQEKEKYIHPKATITNENGGFTATIGEEDNLQYLTEGGLSDNILDQYLFPTRYKANEAIIRCLTDIREEVLGE